MDADSDYLIIKRKSWHEEWCSHRWKADKSRTFKKCSLLNDRFLQMIFVGWKASFFDCYVQSESIQMELLKLIEGNKVFNIWGVCPNWNSWWV